MKTNNIPKSIGRLLFPVLALVFAQTIFAQTTPLPTTLDPSKITYNQISQSLKLFVYPSKGQSQDKQKADEYECYKWAMEQSGVDPMNTTKTEVAPKQEGPTGAGVGGAAKGAIVGTALGSINGNAGEGAAAGAIVGGLAGRRKGKQAQAQQNQQAEATATATDQAKIDSFKKAFSVCIEGKGYTIK
jgi:outer membrane lipoprotein SlyB